MKLNKIDRYEFNVFRLFAYVTLYVEGPDFNKEAWLSVKHTLGLPFPDVSILF